MIRCERFTLMVVGSLTMLAVLSYEALAGPVTGACCLEELCLELTGDHCAAEPQESLVVCERDRRHAADDIEREPEQIRMIVEHDQLVKAERVVFLAELQRPRAAGLDAGEAVTTAIASSDCANGHFKDSRLAPKEGAVHFAAEPDADDDADGEDGDH